MFAINHPHGLTAAAGARHRHTEVVSIARLTAATLLATVTLATGAASATAALPNLDTRARDSGPVASDTRRARDALEQRLGDEGIVTTDRVSGAVRLVARRDGFLTARSGDDAAAIALEYVRAQATLFGLGAADLGALRVTSRYRSPDGVMHVAWTQTEAGIASYDHVLYANVARDGRLLNVGGSAVGALAVDTAVPAIGASAALAAARRSVRGPLTAPRATAGPGPGAERPTRFADGARAGLTIFGDGRAEQLAWRVVLTGEEGVLYEVVVDASSGGVLKRRSLTERVSSANIYRNHPGAANGGSPQAVDLDADPTWLDRSNGFQILRGNNAHAYADTGAPNGLGAGENIAPSAGTNWVFPVSPVAAPGQTCPPAGCTWNSADAATKATNRSQATTQLFWFVNTFHDHLEAAPIGFTHAARGFEFADADGAGPGIGGDPVLAEANDYDDLDDARMSTPPDGESPRLETFFFTNPSLNAADQADVVYHEYTHGLTNRSVGTGAGLDAHQSRALGEGWSDWYALDHLAGEGLVTDGAANGELQIGAYLDAAGFRRQGLDCPVGTSAPSCPGTTPGGPGGFTFGDLGRVGNQLSVHDDGEIWGETLWDLRRALLAETGAARALVTGGLRLAPNNPSFLEARDAIIQADQAAYAGAHHALLWQLFAARGMGYSAATTSASATTTQEAFDLPPLLVHDASAVTDPPPGGDGDDVAEPGETVRLSETLRNRNPFAVTGVSGVLAPVTAGVVAVQRNASWPAIAAATAQPGAPAFEVAIPASASCSGDAQLDLALSGDQGAFGVSLALPVGRKPSTDVPKTVATSTPLASQLTFAGSGTVQGLEVHIARLNHTWVGDLVATLESPSGITITLMDRPGSDPDAAPFGAAGDDLSEVVLVDDAPTSIQSLPLSAPAGGYTGRYRPVQSLSAFDGESRAGTWTLRVSDEYTSADSGTLRSWALRPSACAAPANGRPMAAGDAFSVAQDATLNGAGVLANDSDPDSDPLTAVRTSGPAHGTLALAGDGAFQYTPQGGFSGQDAFTYVAHDGQETSPATTVALTVTAPRVPPPPPLAQPPPPPPPPSSALARAPAKLEVLRAGVAAGRLDVLARITTRAAGRVAVRYRSSGLTTRFTAPISRGVIRISRALPAAQRRKPTGIFTLVYDGGRSVQPDSVTLRAATGKANLVRRTTRIDSRGRLRVAGTITPRARGVVRIRLGYEKAGGETAFVIHRAMIVRGTWSLSAPLPSDGARSGGQLSIQFTGYEPRLIRGEQLAKAVTAAG